MSLFPFALWSYRPCAASQTPIFPTLPVLLSYAYKDSIYLFPPESQSSSRCEWGRNNIRRKEMTVTVLTSCRRYGAFLSLQYTVSFFFNFLDIRCRTWCLALRPQHQYCSSSSSWDRIWAVWDSKKSRISSASLKREHGRWEPPQLVQLITFSEVRPAISAGELRRYIIGRRAMQGF